MRPALNTAIRHDPIDQWARGSIHAWDFLNGTARFNYNRVGRVTNTPGWSATPATHSGGLNTYAQTPGGVLYPFATGQLRRVDGKGVLIEGGPRTNLCLQSQTFENASWTKTNCTISADAAVAPDGTTTADLLTEDTANATHKVVSASITGLTASTVYAASVYIKANGRSFGRLLFLDTVGGADGFRCNFNLSTGAIAASGVFGAGSLTASGVDTLGNGWYRVWVAGAMNNSRTAGQVWVNTEQSAAGTDTFVGDGASGLYLWGAQLEAGAFPSSVVPTVAASATRAADVLTVPVSGIDYPLSLYAEFERVVDTNTTEIIVHLDDGSANNVARINVDGSSTDKAQCVSITGGAVVSNITPGAAIAIGAPTKAAFRVTTNDCQAATSGTLGTQDTVCANPATPTTIRFGSNAAGANLSYGYLRRAALWTRALSDAELQAVTR